MHTAAVQTGGAPPKLTASSPSQQLKTDVSQNVGVSTTPGKAKKRERSDGATANDSSKRERSLNLEEGDSSPGKNDHTDEGAFVDKDGLSSISSVEKLVSAMQQDRNDGSRKPADCASRRTVLAAAITATDNHDCLDRFVQLGGVALFHEWLQETYKGKCGDGESPKDGSKGVEELLLTILSALEKLPVDLQALRCQVGKSVSNLKSHKNSEIKEKARKLVETWKKRVGDEMNGPGGSKGGLGAHGSAWSTNKNPTGASEVAQQTGVQTVNGASLTKKGSTNQPQNNGQLWNNNNVAGALPWKDDVKSSGSPSPGSKANNLTHRSSGKGSLGLNPAASQKETKALVWSRSLDKGEFPAPESSTKVVVRLPRSASAGANEEAFAPGSQGSSPNLPDQPTTSSIADASDARQRLQKYSLPTEPSVEEHSDGVGRAEQKEESEKKQSPVDGMNKSELSRTSDSNDRANSMAIVPVSAISRISGERDPGLGVSGRSTLMSEVGTVDQEMAVAVEPDAAEGEAPSEFKEEARRKDAQDGVDGANCASSSSFTEMSVAGQGGNAEHKSQFDELRETMSSAGLATDENHVGESVRPRLELEGLGESPEPRSSTSQALRRSEEFLKHGGEADASSTQGPKGPFGGRGGYEGAARRLERYENSWDEKRNSYFFGKEGRPSAQNAKSPVFDCKSSSEAESRKNGGEQESTRKAAADFISKGQDNKKMDSTEFVEDDALEVAQQIAKEVEQEVETSHLSSTKDIKILHLAPKEPDSSSDQPSDNAPTEKQENGDLTDCKPSNNVDSSVPPQPAGAEPIQGSKEEPQELQTEVPKDATQVGDEKISPVQVTKPEEEKPAALALSRPVFDLNEGLGGEESFNKDVPCAPVNVVTSVAGPTTPIPVLPTTKGAYIPPESLMKAKSEPGWRGAAATSAFRPAEPRRVVENQQNESKESSQGGKQARQPLDIDLNVADERAMTDAGFETTSLPEKQQASTSGRVDFDLNCADECEDGAGLDMKVESVGVRNDSQGVTSSSGVRGMTRDFDLNAVDDAGAATEEPAAVSVQQMNLRGSEGGGNMVSSSVAASVPGFRGDLVGVTPWFPPGNSFSAVAIPAFPMPRAEAAAAAASYPVPAQPFLNAGGGAIHFNVDLYRGGMTLATPAVAYPANTQVPYPYASFPFASNYSFNTASSAAFPAAGSAAFVDAAGSAASYPAAVSSQVGAPGPMSRFIRPHLMGISEPARTDGSNAWVRPSLDLNTGPEASEDLRPQQQQQQQQANAINGGRGVLLEDHLRGFGQVATQAGKRKEPESGWETFQGYKQPAWC